MSISGKNAPHPGKILSERLDQLGWTGRTFAVILSRPEATVSKILNGSKTITPETALHLAAALGDEPEYWLDLQTRHDLDVARQKGGEHCEKIRQRSRLHRLIPNLEEASKKGWISKHKTESKLLKDAHVFLGISDAQEPDLDIFQGNGVPRPHNAQLRLYVWWRHVLQLGQATNPRRPFSAKKLENFVKEVVMTCGADPDGLRLLAMHLPAAGIALICSSGPRAVEVDAATTTSPKPIIALTLFGDDFGRAWWALTVSLATLITSPPDGTFVWNECLASSALHDDEKHACALADEWHGIPEILARFPAGNGFKQSTLNLLAAGRRLHPAVLVHRLRREWGAQPWMPRRITRIPESVQMKTPSGDPF